MMETFLLFAELCGRFAQIVGTVVVFKLAYKMWKEILDGKEGTK